MYVYPIVGEDGKVNVCLELFEFVVIITTSFLVIVYDPDLRLLTGKTSPPELNFGV